GRILHGHALLSSHCLLTLGRGSSPTDARFSEAANATPPRRLCPARSRFLAAWWSLCRLVPPAGSAGWFRRLVPHVPRSGQRCQGPDKPLATRTPPPEPVWLVNAGVDRDHSPTGACCLVGEDAHGCRPPGLGDAVGPVVIPDPVADRTGKPSC